MVAPHHLPPMKNMDNFPSLLVQDEAKCTLTLTRVNFKQQGARTASVARIMIPSFEQIYNGS